MSEIQTKLCLAWFIARDTVPHTTAHRYRWFPSSKTCSNCGYKKESLSLTERVFECEQCHVVCGRDLNASLNLASLAVSSTVSACRVDSADTTTVKQEVNVKFAHE